jgi:catechol 2,3-dioxygenase-like lactoylglutathione lyase family enzyme
VRSLFDHVTIRVPDREAAEAFYRPLLEILGIVVESEGSELVEWGVFSLATAGADRPATRNLHIGFAAPSRAAVDEFWHAGVAAGHPDDGAPGPRPQYSDDYYGGFLRDPDGNSVEAVHHGTTHERHQVDHLWLSVSDLASSIRFYEAIAPWAGFEPRGRKDDRAHFGTRNGGFTIVAGEPTRAAHLAFPVGDDATVDGFHRTALEAGFRDNGSPGERSEYHAGYYGAFVLDPDGNNVEVVNHNRTSA